MQLGETNKKSLYSLFSLKIIILYFSFEEVRPQRSTLDLIKQATQLIHSFLSLIIYDLLYEYEQKPPHKLFSLCQDYFLIYLLLLDVCLHYPNLPFKFLLKEYQLYQEVWLLVFGWINISWMSLMSVLVGNLI